MLVDVKRANLRFVDVTGLVGEVFMHFQLVLDEEWLNQYVERRRMQED